MLYRLIRHFLFCLPPERAHDFSLKILDYTPTCFFPKPQSHPIKLMGLTFKNPVGLAAGLDKNAKHLSGLAKLGFGFIEVGTITPKPQSGNPKPRLFRLPSHEALINRLGFNNVGVEKLIENIKQSNYQGILGINIGKNATTPLEQANDDYLFAFRRVYPYASYITVNISSPNTQQLRSLQTGDAFTLLLDALKRAQQEKVNETNRYVPLVVKIAPDLTESEVRFIADALLHYQIDGVIATNTTVSRPQLDTIQLSTETGGLSGQPLTDLSTKIIQQLHALLGEKIPIIGVGGIQTPQQMQEKFEAGAKLVQVYTGLIYRGPSLINKLVNVFN